MRLLAAAFSFAALISFSACDKHSWDETKVLHEKYGAHGEHPAGGAAHGEAAKDEHAPAKKDEHGAKAESHGEKK